MRVCMGEAKGRRAGRGRGAGAVRALALALYLVLPCAGAAPGTVVPMHDGGANAANGPEPAWQAVPEAELADARGGFDAGGGRLMSTALVVSFSIERLLTVNGAQVAADRLALAGEGGSAVARHEAAALRAVQVGQGNQLLPSITTGEAALAGAVPALLLQNTANGQFIRAQTTINTTVNSLATLKELNFGDSLRQALATAAAPR